jgi:ATP-dependent Clp protease adaptor protein ClpS
MATQKSPPPDSDGEVELAERVQTKRPRRYQVVLHNDDYTTMEFVVHVLMKFFAKSETEATHIMLNVHRRGYAAAGAYTRDVAETKVSQVTEYARGNGHPLKVTSEPEDDEE